MPLQGKTLPAGRDEYRQPLEGYNEVLDRYPMAARPACEWLGRSGRARADEPPSRRRRKQDPGYRLAGDGVHIDATGHWLIARELLVHLGAPAEFASMTNASAMLSIHPRGTELLHLIRQRQRLLKDTWLTAVGHKRPGMNKGAPLAEAEKQAVELDDKIRALAAPLPGKKSSWNGFDRYDFEVDDKPVLVVVPHQAAPGKPWVWHGEFFGHKPAPDIALLGKGFHVVYMSVPDMLGCPDAVAHWNAFYKQLTENYGFAKKAALVGLSTI
jgi:hypothetical protein